MGLNFAKTCKQRGGRKISRKRMENLVKCALAKRQFSVGFCSEILWVDSCDESQWFLAERHPKIEEKGQQILH